MDATLWNKILDFDFDKPMSEYGFSTRLASENSWTIHFTESAILEYKKFMFLAATTDAMVSPSEILDIVWHQHLIFTKSYSEFGNILGKKIDHIPSTHNPEDFEKFKTAKERTNAVYIEIFGEQPPEIWNFSSIHEPLFLKKSTFKIRTFLVVAIILVVLAILPVAKLLNPIYLKIDNPDFLIYYISIAILLFIALEFHNRDRFSKVLKKADKNAFIFNLSPFELIYLKDTRIDNVIHSNVSEIIKQGKIEITADKKLRALPSAVSANLMEFSIISTLLLKGTMPYPLLFKMLLSKSAFTSVPQSMQGFLKYVVKSQFFVRLYIFNFILLALLFLVGAGRLIIGISREKPVGQLLFILFIIALCVAYHLFRMTLLIGKQSIHKYYKLLLRNEKEKSQTWPWVAYLFGNAALTASFTIMLPEKTSTDILGNSRNSSCGSSSGSSCGSSCGSCGGCGGD